MRLIDADELQERLAQMRIGDLLSIGEYETLSKIVTMQATADRNHGKWEATPYEVDGEHPLMMCSECGFVLDRDIESDNYCPHCGSRNR